MPEEFTFSSTQRLRALTDVFCRLFWSDYRTLLQGGGSEPVYCPADRPEVAHRIIYTADYFSSALHEVAHWCIAGADRRQLRDYGYWYAPDGRSPAQQAAFERCEVRPQALERIFSCASAQPFRVSVDNLNAGADASQGFLDAVHRQTHAYCDSGLPGRAARFARELARTFGVDNPLDRSHYNREDLK